MKTPKTLLAGISAALFLSLSSPASAATSQDWSMWVSNYYQAPQPDQVVDAVFAMSRQGFFEQKGQTASSIGFFATVLAQNSEKAEGWMNSFRNLPVAHQRIMASAYWYSGLPNGDQYLRALSRNASLETRQAINEMLAQKFTPVSGTPVRSESSVNLQMGAYLASGDARHIMNVLGALGSSDPALSTAARIALAEKAAAHPAVYQICQSQLDRQPAGVSNQLRAALSANQPAR